MLESPWMLRYSLYDEDRVRECGPPDSYSSDKSSAADNQQERLIKIGWIVGFVDGEGCFSIHIVRQPERATRRGYRTGFQGGASVCRDTRREKCRVSADDAAVLQCGPSTLQSQIRQPQRTSVSVRCLQAERSSFDDHSVLSEIPATDLETIRFRQVRNVYGKSKRTRISRHVGCSKSWRSFKQ